MMVGSGLGSVFPWLSVDGDVSVDDLSIEKVSSQAEPQPLRRVAPYEFAKATCAFPAARPPVIDGKLDDPCWKDVPAAGAFLTYGDERSEASPPTTFKAVFDQHALYLAVSCAEPGMAGLVNPAQGVDTGTEQYVGVNSLEIFLDPGRTRAHCYQFVVAADGREYDGEGKDAKWHVQWLASPSVGADGWTLELAIPYASLGVGAPRTGDTWGLNVCRNRGPYDSNATWSPVGEVFHTPALFGALVFGSYRQWHEEVFVKGRQALEARLRQRPGGAEGLERIERFAARLDETVKKDGLPADWRTFSRLHYQAAFVMDALENLERHQRWAELLEAKGMDDKNINTR